MMDKTAYMMGFAYALGRAYGAGIKHSGGYAQDKETWITVHPNGKGVNANGEDIKGSHVLIDDASGKILGGLGGKFKGKKISSLKKKSKGTKKAAGKTAATGTPTSSKTPAPVKPVAPAPASTPAKTAAPASTKAPASSSATAPSSSAPAKTISSADALLIKTKMHKKLQSQEKAIKSLLSNKSAFAEIKASLGKAPLIAQHAWAAKATTRFNPSFSGDPYEEKGEVFLTSGSSVDNVFHEAGHSIDYKGGGKYRSADGRMAKMIKQDTDAMLKGMEPKIAEVEKLLNTKKPALVSKALEELAVEKSEYGECLSFDGFKDELKDAMAEMDETVDRKELAKALVLCTKLHFANKYKSVAITDLAGAILAKSGFKNTDLYGPSHNAGYWYKEGNDCIELFANLYRDLAYLPECYQAVKKIMPGITSWFENELASLTG